MAITDLLRSVPIPLLARWRTAAGDAPKAAPEPIPTFGDGRNDPAPFLMLGDPGPTPSLTEPPAPAMPSLASPSLPDAGPPPDWSPVPFEEEVSVPWTFPEPLPAAAKPTEEPPPTQAGIGLHRIAALCLGVSIVSALAALMMLGTNPPTADAPPAADLPDSVESGSPPPPADAGMDLSRVAGASAAGVAEPTSIPADMITRLEAAADDSLPVELGHLLDAMNFAFGTESARLDPALRSYVYRMASRFEWNPDTFRISVSAPSEPLASARAELIRALFSEAVASQRLVVESSTGPHALSLVSE